MAQLRRYENTEEVFYAARALDVTKLSNVEAAARTIFLNRTCFNGLYRVNKSGQFNVPFGRYKNPKIIDEDALKAASALLSNTTIICGDYKTVLKENAQTGDFIFLDPPYLPVSEYADFKRYTKEQFYEEDHVELAAEVKRIALYTTPRSLKFPVEPDASGEVQDALHAQPDGFYAGLTIALSR